MRRTLANALVLVASIALSLAAPNSAKAQPIGAAQHAEIVRGLMTQANLSRIDREKADEREIGLIVEYESRIGSANGQIAALDLKARDQRALTVRERTARRKAEDALERGREALAELAERLANASTDWAAEREVLRAKIEERVAVATPEMAAALQRFADGERVEANRILEHLENIQIETEFDAARQHQVVALRARVERRQIMWIRGEMQPADVAATYREIVALSLQDLDVKLQLAAFDARANEGAKARADLDMAARLHTAIPDQIRICLARARIENDAGALGAAFDIHQACLAQARIYAAAQHDNRLLRAALDQAARLKAYQEETRVQLRRQLEGENVAVTRVSQTEFASLADWRNQMAVRMGHVCESRDGVAGIACQIEVLDTLLANSSSGNLDGYYVGQALDALLRSDACLSDPQPLCQDQADRVVRAFKTEAFFNNTDPRRHNAALSALRQVAEWQVQTEAFKRAVDSYQLMLANSVPIIRSEGGLYIVHWEVISIYAGLTAALGEAGDRSEALRACDALLEIEQRAFSMNTPGGLRSSRMADAYASNGDCHSEQGDAPGALGPYRKSVQARRELVRAGSAEPLQLDLFVDVLGALAEAELRAGNQHEAWPLFAEAIAALRPLALGPRDGDAAKARNLAHLYTRSARGLAADQQTSRADAEYLRAIAIRERLDQLPDPRGRRISDLADLLWEYGTFLIDSHRPRADTAYKRSVEASKVAAGRPNPRQSSAREAYGQRLGDYGAYLEAQNDGLGAITSYQLRLEMFRELAAMEKPMVLPSELAEAYVALATAQNKFGRQDDAIVSFRAALNVLAKEATSHGYRKSLRRDLNKAFDALENIYLDRSDGAGLAEISGSILPLREQYFLRYPADEDIRSELAKTLMMAGMIKRIAGEKVIASEYLKRCVELAAQSGLSGDQRKAIDAVGAACQGQMTPSVSWSN